MLATGPSGRPARRPKSACAAGLPARAGAQCAPDAPGARREPPRAGHDAAPAPDPDGGARPRRPQPPLSARSRDSGFSCYQGLSTVEGLRWEMQVSSEQCRQAVRLEIGPLTEVLCDHIASAVNQTVTEVMVGVRAELAASREEQLADVRGELLRLREEQVAHSNLWKDLLARHAGARQHEKQLELTTLDQQLENLQLELAALRRELHSGTAAFREDAQLAAERLASELRAMAAEQRRDATAAAERATAQLGDGASALLAGVTAVQAAAKAAQQEAAAAAGAVAEAAGAAAKEQRSALASELQEAAGKQALAAEELRAAVREELRASVEAAGRHAALSSERAAAELRSCAESGRDAAAASARAASELRAHVEALRLGLAEGAALPLGASCAEGAARTSAARAGAPLALGARAAGGLSLETVMED